MIRYIKIYINMKLKQFRVNILNKTIISVQNPKLRIGKNFKLELGGKSKFISSSNEIYDNTSISIDDNGLLALYDKSWIGSNVNINANSIILGRYSAIHAFGTLIGDVQVGEYVMIAKNVFISSGKHHYNTEFPYLPIKIQDKIYFEQFGELNAPVIIDDDVWIGVNCVVMSGVRIGKGAIVGSNSVVTSNIEPYSIYAGSPAKLIKYRLDFVPPKSISASNLKDYPYFYSGFNIAAEPFVPIRDAVALEVLNRFSLALDIEDEKYISLEIRSVDKAKKLCYEEQIVDISTEYSIITYNIMDNSTIPLCFWTDNSNKIYQKVEFEIKNIYVHKR